MKQLIYQKFLRPRSSNPDDQRREFILNILLFGLFCISVIAGAAQFIEFLNNKVVNGLGSFLTTVVFCVVIVGFWKLGRRGWYAIVSYILLAAIGYLALSLVLEWSINLPAAELCFGLMIVMAGVLLSARSALKFGAVAIIVLLVVSYGQIVGRWHTETGWIKQQPVLSDAVGYVVIFSIIILVSWLSNREIDRSLVRARSSEAALEVERDSLEIKVLERTQELEQAQLLRTMELQRFAEFGRLSTNLLHEVSNPLTAASLNLEQLDDQQSQLVLQARRSIQQIERYVAAARKQLQNQSQQESFKIKDELEPSLQLLRPLARASHVTINTHKLSNYSLFGDPVKFNQIVTNLIVNAIDAYSDSERPNSERQIVIDAKEAADHLTINVTDWGKGIKADQLPHIFDLFYSTKTSNKRSMGVGLSMLKQFVEEDFHGSIKVTSSPQRGTRFSINLRKHNDQTT